MEQQQQQKKQLTPLQNFNLKIKDVKMQEYLSTVLGKKKDQFVTTLISAVANNENLQQCEPMSLVYTALKATSLGLPIDPNLSYAAMIPYKNGKNGLTECQFQVMRTGWVELVQRTGQVQALVNEAVHEGELVKKNRFTGEYVFDEDKKKSDKVIGYMAYIKLINGFEKTVYWTMEECIEHAKRYSQTYRKGYGLWVDNFDAMAKKTVLKHLLNKYAPKSVELQNAILADQATFDANGNPNYIDAPDEVRLRLSQQAPEDQEQPEEKEAAAETKKGALRARKNEAEQAPQDGSIFPSKPEDLP